MQTHTPSSTRRLLTGSALVGLALNAVAGSDQPASSPAADASGTSSSFLAWQLAKPAWLTDVSVSLKEGYDDNVLMVSGAGPLQPQASFITTLAGKVGFNFAPLLGEDSPFKVLSLGYGPEFDVYHNAPDLTFSSHKITDSIKGDLGDFSFNVDNSFTYVDGNSVAPIYPGDDRLRSAFATVADLQRVKQIKEEAKLVLQYNMGSFFIRPTASFLYNDMLTELLPTTGYQNYPSRYDLNGGLDFGYHLTTDFAVTLGYRYGHQYQATLPENVDDTQLSSGSDYQRVLLGIEGKPWHWLTIAAQGGPDFRDYNSTAAVSDQNTTTYYGEATATAEVTANDSLSFKYKAWRWVACTGRVPYMDINYVLTYHRKLTDQLSFDLGGRIGEYDFTCGSDPAKKSNLRDDFYYSVSPSLSYAVTRNFVVTASGTIGFGRNAQNNPPDGAEYREFDQNLASLACTYKF